MEAAFDWLSKFFQSLTVGGWVLFVTALVAFLIASAYYLMKHGGSREAWFTVGIVTVALGAGLRFGIPYATELLALGIDDSVKFIPSIQDSVEEAFQNVGKPWGWDDVSGAGDGTVTLTESDVTIVATPGPIESEAPTPTPSPSVVPGADATPETTTPAPTLTEDEHAATTIAITREFATPTPRPPTAVPTIDNDLWNPLTPAPTPIPGG